MMRHSGRSSKHEDSKRPGTLWGSADRLGVDEGPLLREVERLAPAPLEQDTWKSPYGKAGALGVWHVLHLVNPLNRARQRDLAHLQPESQEDFVDWFANYHALATVYYTLIGVSAFTLTLTWSPPDGATDGTWSMWCWAIAHGLFIGLTPLCMTIVGVFCLDTMALGSVRQQDLRRFVNKHVRTFTWNR